MCRRRGRRARAGDAPGRPYPRRRAGQRGALLVQLGAERHGSVRDRASVSSPRWRLARGESPAAQTGPLVPGLLAAHGIEPVSVQLFPVTVLAPRPAGRARLGRAPRGGHRRDRQGAGRIAAPPRRRLPQGASIDTPATPPRAGVVVRRDPEHDALRDGRAAGRMRDRSRRRARAGTSTRRSTTGRTRRPSARRDVAFWRRLAAAQRRAGARARVRHRPHRAAGRPRPARALVGIDRSAPMLDAGAAAAAARPPGRSRPAGPRRHPRAAVPPPHGFGCVMAPYGVLQSLTRERDSGDAGVGRPRARPGGLFALDLVPGPAALGEYSRRTSLRGAARQRHADAHRVGPPGPPPRADDLRPGVRRAPGRHAPGASLRADVPHAVGAADARRLEKAGFAIDAVLGDYQGGPWDERADIWVILARKPADGRGKVAGPGSSWRVTGQCYARSGPRDSC